MNNNQDPVFPTQPIERVREGMTVLDAAGERLGTVAYLKMGDPEAATTQGNEARGTMAGAVLGGDEGEPGAPGVAGLGVREPNVPEPLRTQLMRVGFLRLDAPHLKNEVDRYVPGDRIRDVSGDTVRLAPIGAPSPPPAAVSTVHRDAVVVQPDDASAATMPPPPAAPLRPRLVAAGVGVGAGSLVGVVGGTIVGLVDTWRHNRNERAGRVRRRLTRLGKQIPRGGERVRAVRVGRRPRRGWVAPALGGGSLLAAVGGYLLWRARGDGETGSGQQAGGEAWRQDQGGTMQLVEEELQARTQVQTGEVRVAKELVAEERSIDVPLTREEIVVQRRPVDREPTDQPVGQGEHVEVTATSEHIAGIEKQAVVTEEVNIGKRVQQDTARVSDTVRREVVRVEREGDVPVRDDADQTGVSRPNPPSS